MNQLKCRRCESAHRERKRWPEGGRANVEEQRQQRNTKSIRKAKRRIGIEIGMYVRNVANANTTNIRLVANSTIRVISLNKACNFAIFNGEPISHALISLDHNLPRGERERKRMKGKDV